MYLEEPVGLVAIAKDSEDRQRQLNLLRLYITYIFNQFRSEFTDKLLLTDIPLFATQNLEQYSHYKGLFQLYSTLDLTEMVTNFNNYMTKMLTQNLPYSKAKYILNRFFLFDHNQNVLLNHSFVENSHRNLNHLNSDNFRSLLRRYEIMKSKTNTTKSVRRNSRRRTTIGSSKEIS